MMYFKTLLEVLEEHTRIEVLQWMDYSSSYVVLYLGRVRDIYEAIDNYTHPIWGMAVEYIEAVDNNIMQINLKEMD